jgi:HD-like signal output (HDOD) protein
MNTGASFDTNGRLIRPTPDRECLLAINEALNNSERVFGLLNQAIINPHTTSHEVAMILHGDTVLPALIIRLANSTLVFNTKKLCDTVDDALRLVGLREIARLVANATLQNVAATNLRN